MVEDGPYNPSDYPKGVTEVVLISTSSASPRGTAVVLSTNTRSVDMTDTRPFNPVR